MVELSESSSDATASVKSERRTLSGFALCISGILALSACGQGRSQGDLTFNPSAQSPPGPLALELLPYVQEP